MRLLIFDPGGILRRVSGGFDDRVTYRVSKTEAYFADKGVSAIEIRHRLFGFRPFGLLKPQREQVVTVTGDDGTPLHLSSGSANEYREATLAKKEQGTKLNAANKITGQMAHHRAALDAKGATREKLYTWVICLLLVAFLVQLVLWIGPGAIEKWRVYFGGG